MKPVQLHYGRIKSERTCAREMCRYLQRLGQVAKNVHYINWWNENRDLVRLTYLELV